MLAAIAECPINAGAVDMPFEEHVIADNEPVMSEPEPEPESAPAPAPVPTLEEQTASATKVCLYPRPLRPPLSRPKRTCRRPSVPDQGYLGFDIGAYGYGADPSGVSWPFDP